MYNNATLSLLEIRFEKKKRPISCYPTGLNPCTYSVQFSKLSQTCTIIHSNNRCNWTLHYVLNSCLLRAWNDDSEQKVCKCVWIILFYHWNETTTKFAVGVGNRFCDKKKDCAASEENVAIVADDLMTFVLRQSSVCWEQLYMEIYEQWRYESSLEQKIHNKDTIVTNAGKKLTLLDSLWFATSGRLFPFLIIVIFF